MNNLLERPLNERFDHLLAILSSDRFLKMQGLGNEVPFFICPFKPEETLEMNKLGHQLIRALENKGIRVLKINLYDLSIELLQKRGVWDRVLAVEETITKDELKELLQGVLDPEQHLVPAISEKMAQEAYEVMFITGVGEVFPYIRSHTVLNNLQSTAKDRPTVMFFPGEYTHSAETGASLNLFGRLHDDNYYRAFNIYHSQV
jgi:hypothetical protein